MNEGEWPNLYYPHFTLAPTPENEGRGIARALTKGVFRWASPLQFKKESRHLCPRRQ